MNHATRAMALSATLHCLTGCAIGEILGLAIGTALRLRPGGTGVLAGRARCTPWPPRRGIGAIVALVICTALGLRTGWTVVLAVSLAFLFGYALSTLPLVRAGLGVGAALSVVLAADTLSIATM